MPISKALKTLSFYKWAFGDLTEQDSDIGMLAEYLVGDILNCLPPSRKVNAPFDLIMKDGTTLEIKATTHKYARKGKTPYYRWKVSTQSDCGLLALPDGYLSTGELWCSACGTSIRSQELEGSCCDR